MKTLNNMLFMFFILMIKCMKPIILYATDTVILKRTMLEVFKQKASPTMFLSSWFKTGTRDMFRSSKCVIDIKRNQEKIAVDVVRGTGGRMANNKRFTTKEFIPPVYDQYSAYSEEELNNRMPGKTEYENPDYMSELLAIVTDDMVENQDTILRAIEKQASDALFTGSITPVNGTIIDFKQKATHQHAAALAWSSSSSLPWDDISAACVLNRKDGKIMSNRFIALFADDAWSQYETRLLATGRLDTLNDSAISLIAPVMNTSGAVFMGTIKCGPYMLEAWTYPQFYQVPAAAEIGGIVLPNAGTTVQYVPAERVLIIPPASAIDLRLVYAGIPELKSRVEDGFRLPVIQAGDFHPYFFTDDKTVSSEAGIRTAPLCIPTQIDGFTIIDTTP
ncbi:major capsid protein [Candidatus Pacearchaeota archaeon]|nr:major capsid protein [Candidatus Pacearchaeota archaeon]